MFSLLVWVTPHLLTFAEIQPLAGVILAGILSGTGLLVLFRHRASLGGIGIMAVWLQEKTGFRGGLDPDGGRRGGIRAGGPDIAADGGGSTASVGAVALNLVIAINHRADRYIGM